MLWADAKKARRIKADMWKQNLKFHQLSYRDMEHLRQVRARDKHPEALGEVTNLELNSASFSSCRSVVTHSPLPRASCCLSELGSLRIRFTAGHVEFLVHSLIKSVSNKTQFGFQHTKDLHGAAVRKCLAVTRGAV